MKEILKKLDSFRCIWKSVDLLDNGDVIIQSICISDVSSMIDKCNIKKT